MTPWEKRVFVIGEAGVNHNGDEGMALSLVEAAAAAGCDAVKFQTFSADRLAVAGAPLATYQQDHVRGDASQRELLAGLQLSHDAHRKLMQRAADLGIVFLSTAFDSESVEFLGTLSLPLWKIPSGEITNFPMLARVARFGCPTLVSTGMSSIAEIGAAVDVLLAHGLERGQICLLQCNTQYPTPFGDVNLLAMPMLGRAFGTSFGYSDHTPGTEIAIASTALGARVIEKHLTLDRTLPGPDHAASLEPDQLANMVAAIRNVEMALGSTVKQMTRSESANRSIARKSIVAARIIRVGEVFSSENLTTMRPGTGIDPMRWPDLVGTVARRDYHEGEMIEW